MASNLTQHWTAELPSIAACGLVPMLPSPQTLRDRADAAVRPQSSTGPNTTAPCPPTTSGSSYPAPQAPGAGLLFHSAELYEAVRQCVEAEPGIPPKRRLVATLLIASVAMEDYVRSHSTKATLLASHNARIVRAMEEQQQAVEAAARQPPAQAQAADGAEVDAELLQFLTRSSPEEVVDRLLQVLGEAEAMRPQLARVLKPLGPKDVATILTATKKAVT
jgi:hypothetical protein